MKKSNFDTHHIVPVSIGGSDKEENKIRVDKVKHQIYHFLFNNWHPSAIIRFLFLDFLKAYFQIEINVEQEPFKNFLKTFDEKMKNLVDNSDNSSEKIIIEEKEKIKQININFENMKRKEKFKIGIKELLDAWNNDFEPDKVIEKLCECWFNLREELELEEVVKYIGLKKFKGQ